MSSGSFATSSSKARAPCTAIWSPTPAGSISSSPTPAGDCADAVVPLSPLAGRGDEAPMPTLTIEAAVESWPIAGEFVIARGAKREAAVVVAQVSDGKVSGRGECVPYARYRETVEGVRG